MRILYRPIDIYILSSPSILLILGTTKISNVILYDPPQAKEGTVPDLSLGLTITPLSSSTNGH